MRSRRGRCPDASGARQVSGWYFDEASGERDGRHGETNDLRAVAPIPLGWGQQATWGSALMWWLLLVLSAFAREPLTLQQALDAAYGTHPTGAVAEARLQQARAERTTAWSAFGPQLSTTGIYTRRPFEVRAPGAEGNLLQARDALRATGRFDITLIDIAAAQSVAAAGTGVRAQERNSEELLRVLGFRVADAFLTVLASERLLTAAERRAAVAAELVRAAEARLNAGVATRNAVTRTALEQATADLAVVEARGDLEAARVSLAVLIGAAEIGPLVPPRLDVEGEARAVPAIEALELQARQARQEARAQVFGYLPSIGAYGAGVATNEAGFSGRTHEWSAGALANWSLFDGARRMAVASRLRAVGDELSARADELDLDVREALGRARADIETARAGLALARRQAEVARVNVEELRERFGSGLASALEVSDAAASAFEAEVAVALQELELDRARLRLADAMGYRAEELL